MKKRTLIKKTTGSRCDRMAGIVRDTAPVIAKPNGLRRDAYPIAMIKQVLADHMAGKPIRAIQAELARNNPNAPSLSAVGRWCAGDLPAGVR